MPITYISGTSQASNGTWTAGLQRKSTAADGTAAGAHTTSTDFSSILKLSQEAQNKIQEEKIPAWATQQSNSLREEKNQAVALETVKLYAMTPDAQLVSVKNSPDGIHGVTYSSSGLPVTPESTAEFEAASKSVLSGRMALYATEAAKGTAAADIFDKLQHFMAAQPESYLQKTNWNGTA